MNTIRQIHQVHNNKIVIELPANFTSDQVEVILQPVVTQHPINDELIAEYMAQDISDWTVAQKEAHARILFRLQNPLPPDSPREFGLFAGLVEISDDFNAPLPKAIEDLFWGSETDAYGLSLDNPTIE